MAKVRVLFPLVILLGVISCGGGSAGSGAVAAQSSQYSNSNLSGTYAVSVVGIYVTNDGSAIFDGAGTVTANGSGGITGGTITEYFSGGVLGTGASVTCQFSLSGSYDVTNSTGSGTATVTGSVTSGPCSGQTTAYAVELAQSGASALFAESDSTEWSSGTLLKQ